MSIYCHLRLEFNIEIRYHDGPEHTIYIQYMHIRTYICTVSKIREWPRNINKSIIIYRKSIARDKVLIIFRHFKDPLPFLRHLSRAILQCRRGKLRCADRKIAHTTIKDLYLSESIFCFTAPLLRSKLFTSRELNKMTLKPRAITAILRKLVMMERDRSYDSASITNILDVSIQLSKYLRNILSDLFLYI